MVYIFKRLFWYLSGIWMMGEQEGYCSHSNGRQMMVVWVRWVARMYRPRTCTLKVEPVKLTDELDMRDEEMDIRMSLRFLV